MQNEGMIGMPPPWCGKYEDEILIPILHVTDEVPLPLQITISILDKLLPQTKHSQ